MNEIAALRQKSESILQAARTLFDAGYFEDCISRAYYAMFHAAQAALLSEGIAPSTHKGTHTLFDKHFAKTGRLPRHIARTLRQTYDARQLADYGVETAVSRDMAEHVLKDATVFLSHIAAILSS